MEVKIEFWDCPNCGQENTKDSIICKHCSWKNPDIKIDSDSDGMSDYWEMVNKLNSQDATDAHLDPDNDSRDNLQEFIDNTDPWVKDLSKDSLNSME